MCAGSAVDSSRGGSMGGRFRWWRQWLLVEWQRELAGAGKVCRLVSGEASAMAVGGLPRWFR
jgi:hypothetical protein